MEDSNIRPIERLFARLNVAASASPLGRLDTKVLVSEAEEKIDHALQLLGAAQHDRAEQLLTSVVGALSGADISDPRLLRVRARVLLFLGNTRRDHGHVGGLTGAFYTYCAARTLFEHLEEWRRVTEVNVYLASCLEMSTLHPAALATFQYVIDQAGSRGYQDYVTWGHLRAGTILTKLGHLNPAAKALERAAILAEGLDDSSRLAIITTRKRAALARADGNFDLAMNLALAVPEPPGSAPRLAQVQHAILIADIMHAAGDSTAALRELDRGHALAVDAGFLHQASVAEQLLASFDGTPRNEISAGGATFRPLTAQELHAVLKSPT